MRTRACSRAYDGGQECGTGWSGLVELQVALFRYPKSFVLVAMYVAAPVNCEGNLPAMFAKKTCKVG
jgi:hypothetical protein